MVFEPRQIVNGAILRNHIGRSISIFVKLEGDCSGQLVRGRTTDNQEVKIHLPEALSAIPADWLEIIGSPVNQDTIRAREVIQFDTSEEEFDVESHNMLVLFLNNCKDIFNNGN